MSKGLFAVVLAVSLLAGCLTVTAAAPAAGGDKGKPNVTPGGASSAAEKKAAKQAEITRLDFCHSCTSMIETFARYAYDKAVDRLRAHRMGDGFRRIEMSEYANAICLRTPFSDFYKPQIKYGCIKIMNDFPEAIFDWFNQEHSLKPFEGLYKHRWQACVNEIKACTPTMVVADSLGDNTPCGACIAVVEDISTILYREATLSNKQRITDVIYSVCDDAPMRHKNPMPVEEVCESLFEDVSPQEIGSIFRMRKALEDRGTKPTGTVVEKICSEMTDFCKRPQRKLGPIKKVTLPKDDEKPKRKVPVVKYESL